MLESHIGHWAERIVRPEGISDRNWEMFCWRQGSHSGGCLSLQEIAVAFGVSESRVSQILASVKRRFEESESDLTDQERLRRYRLARCRSIEKEPVENASTVRDVVESVFALKWAPPYDYATIRRKKMSLILLGSNFRFIAEGRCWKPVGFSRKRLESGCARSYEYAFIGWMQKSDGPVRFGLIDLIRPAPIVFDCGGKFYVLSESRPSPSGECEIHLKPLNSPDIPLKA